MTLTQRADALEHALAQAGDASDEDTLRRIDLLNALAWELSDVDAGRAAALAEKAHALADTPANDSGPYHRGIAYSLRTQGYLDMRSGDYPRGMARLLRAQTIFEALKSEGEQAVDDGLVDVFDGIAGIYGQMGDLSETLAYSYKMLEVAERAGDLRRVANARNNLGHIYFETGEHAKALAILHQNARQAAEIDYRRIEVLSYLNLAHVYYLIGDAPTALEHALGGLCGAREAAFASFETYALDYLGKISLKLGDHAAALDYLEQALGASRRIGSRATEALNLLTLGQTYADIGRPEQALDYLRQSLAIAQAIEAKPELLAAHLTLSELYERQGDTAQALAHFKQHHALKELVAGERANQRLKVLQVAHDTETARHEARALQRQTAELQREIRERVRTEAQLKRQLDTVRALSAFSTVLLGPATSEAQRQRLLSAALQHLLAPAQASRAALGQNIDDAELGLCSRSVADVTASSIAPSAHDRDLSPGLARQVGERLSSARAQAAESAAALFAWSLVPPEVPRKLAAGLPVGGPTREVCAVAPAWRDHLLHTIGIRSFQLFPIRIGKHWWGWICLADEAGERRWSEEETLLLSTAAEMAASAIQRWQTEDQLRRLNDQLEEQIEQRTAQLRNVVATLERRVAARTAEVATFFDLILLAGQAGRLADVFAQVLPRIIEVTRSQAISIHLLDERRACLQLAGQLNLASNLPPTVAIEQLPHAFQRWMAQPSDPLLTTARAKMTALPPTFGLPGLQTYLGAQIKIGAHIEGLLSCYRTTDRGYSVDEVALVTALAEQIGMMVATQQLHQNTRALAVVEERQRLARDMHDSVNQSLYSLALFAQTGREAAEDGDAERLAFSLDSLQQTSLHALAEMRLLLYELRPADLQQEGLVRAIQLRLEAVERRTGLQLTVQLDELPGLDARLEADLYYIIVEALNNVVKHAAATGVTLQLTQTDQQVLVRVSDDGRGFDPQQAEGGMGLRNIRERAGRVNGTLTISAAPGRGTQLVLRIPL